MAITSGASPGVIVTTAAVNETIPAQTNVADANTQVELSDDISTLSNGNLMSTPLYTSRLIILRQGLSNEETRYVSVAAASGVGSTWILTVSEAWTVNPVASTDTIHVSYIIQDAATLTGLGLVNKTVQDYSSARRFTVGSGSATFAFMAFLNGVGLQLDDNGSTTVASFTIESDGRFDCGYLIGGTPTGGCYLQGANGADGELAFEMISGGEWNCYATYVTGVYRELVDFNTSTTSKIRMNGVRWSFAINDVLWGVQDTDLNNVAFLSDDTGTTPRIHVRDWATGNETKNIVCNGFNGLESNTAGDDPVIRNIQLESMSKLLTIATTEIWTIINPIWTVDDTAQADISIAGTGEVLEQFSLDVTATEADGTAIVGKNYSIDGTHRGATSTVILDEQTSSATGTSSFDVEARRMVDNAGTSLTVTTSSEFANIQADYGFLPAIFPFTPSNEDATSATKLYGQRLSFTLLPDTFQSETTAATAITLGDTTNTVAIETQTNPAIILKWTGGTGTGLAVGEVLGNNVNAAEATLLEIIEGNSTAGTGIFDTANVTAWTDVTQTLDDGVADWSAAYTVGSLLEYDWLINASTLTSQQLYDYINAKLDEASLDILTPTFFDDVLLWANGGTTPLPIVGETLGTPNIFKTIRNVADTSGWAIYGLSGGLGSIKEYVSNDGSLFTPIASVPITITVLESDFTTVNPGARVGIHKASDNTEILNQVTDGAGQVTGSYTESTPLSVIIRTRDESFDFKNQPATITSTGLTLTIVAEDDDVYA
jgi:hypothetical protein